MTPLPKRKHSTQRKGKRLKTKAMALSNLVICNNCKRPKLPHRVCKYCQK